MAIRKRFLEEREVHNKIKLKQRMSKFNKKKGIFETNNNLENDLSMEIPREKLMDQEPNVENVDKTLQISSVKIVETDEDEDMLQIAEDETSETM